VGDTAFAEFSRLVKTIFPLLADTAYNQGIRVVVAVFYLC